MLVVSPETAAVSEIPAVTLQAPGFGRIATGDLTGDGVPDLAAILDGDLIALWAAPVFGDPSVLLDVASPSDLAVGDLDGDGRGDLAVSTAGGVSLFLQSGGVLAKSGEVGGSAPGILLADLNGDGMDDLVTWNATGLLVHIIKGGTDVSPASSVIEGGDSVAAGDLNGDGLMEIVVSTSQSLVIHYFDAAGRIVSSRDVRLGGSFAGSKVRAADIDGDGWPEVVLLRTGVGGSELALYAGGPSQSLQQPDLTMEEAFSGEFLLADLNGDGVGDLAAVLKDGAVVVVDLSATPGGLDVSGTVLIPPRGAGTDRYLAAADLLQDGRLELAVRAVGTLYVHSQSDAPPRLIGEIPRVDAAPGETASIHLDRYFSDDRSPLTYRVVGETETVLSFEVKGEVLLVTVPEGWSGQATVAVEAWDGASRHGWVRSNEFVVFVNDPPRIASVPPTRTSVGDTYTYYVTAYDDYPLDDVVRYVILEAPSGMTVDRDTGRLTWGPEDAGEYGVLLAARDAHGGEDLQSFSVKVAPLPAAPFVGPSQVMAAGAAALFGVLAAWSVANENARFSTGLLVAPLYTKLKREQILQHFIRGQIYGYVLANPGEHYNAIREALGLTNGCLAHHLRTLEREGFVKSRKFGLYRRFYPRNMRIPEDGEYVNEVRRTIIDVIRGRPGISQVEIAHALNVTPPTVNYHLGILAKANKVKVVRRGRRTHCFAV